MRRNKKKRSSVVNQKLALGHEGRFESLLGADLMKQIIIICTIMAEMKAAHQMKDKGHSFYCTGGH